MAKIEIIKNAYNVVCDTYGCSNPAPYIIGKIGEGQAQKILLCEECLQGIIDAAPLDMILEKPGLKEYFEKTEKVTSEENIPIKFNTMNEGLLKEMGKAQKGKSKGDS